MEKKSKNKQVRSVGSKVSRKKTPNPKEKNKKKHTKLKKFFIILLLLFVLLILVGIGIFCGIFFSDKFALSKEDLLLANANTVIYDKDGNVIAELSGDENREIISIGDMSEYLPKAFVAIEDERFYNHSGVDLKRTLAATSTYLLKGDSSFGGSTITQQLIKNQMFDAGMESTLSAKIELAFIASIKPRKTESLELCIPVSEVD